MKIVIINLKKSTKKRELVKTQLANFEKWSGITVNYQFFEAIDGNNLKKDDIHPFSGWFDPWSHLHLTKGEVGCALSHLKLWEMLINDCENKKNNDGCMMILEDDFIIKNKSVFKDILQIKNPSFEFLYLGRKKISKQKETENDILKNLNITQHKTVQSKFSYWTLGYILSYKGAKKLYYGLNVASHKTSWFQNNIFPVDEYIPWMYGENQIYSLSNLNKKESKNDNCFLALEPSIIEPINNTFQNSGTYFSPAIDNVRKDVILVSVATDFNDAVKRYIDTSRKYGFDPIILGLNKQWKGGNMAAGMGGGQKVNMLREFLKTVDNNKLVIFTDSYDVIANNHINVMIENYKKYYNDKIVFGSEKSCWPNRGLAQYFPKVKQENKFLNSGNFIGWREDLIKMVDLPIKDNEDDQLYYIYYFLRNLQKNGYEKSKIRLDYENHLFLCLNDADNYSMDHSKSCIIMNNKERPSFIHGNGPPIIKRKLNQISNYCVGGWNSTYGYKSICPLRDELPKIDILYDVSLGFNKKTYDSLLSLNFPHNKIKIVKIKQNDIPHIANLKLSNKVDFILYVNSNIIIENPNCLIELVNEDKSVIAPLFKKKNELFSNFWGAIRNDNFYLRSDDYLDLVNMRKKGCWNVPYVGHCFLMKTNIFKSNLFTDNLDKGDGMDMAMCYNLRKQNTFMWMLNKEHYGYFEDFKQESSSKNNLLDTKIKSYVKSILTKEFLESPKIEEIGENILKINIFTKEFCKEVLKKCNSYGKWSKGGNSHFDKRLGAVENHPTQDIHLSQIHLNKVWKYIIEHYISKIIWETFHYSTKDINISFVVKYDMEHQRELKPHHDASTYTVNLCLNNDFEGGGCHFIKQKQTIINKDIGSVIIHPGKLTHYHEGLPIIDGERYILVSFIN